MTAQNRRSTKEYPYQRIVPTVSKIPTATTQSGVSMLFMASEGSA